MADAPTAGEFDLIARYLAPLAAAEPGAFGLTDDAAVLAVDPGRRLVVTMDSLVAGVHFLADDPADAVAAKLVGVNLSDLAAMGARPFAYALSVALPADEAAVRRETWFAAFVRGLAEAQADHGLTLVGGDTVSTPGPTTLTLTAFGTVAPDGALRRSGARAGDAVFVSGTIGDAALGLVALREGLAGLADADRAFLIDRYRRPRPRVGLGLRLAGLAGAAIDVSDGLAADLGHVCEASGVGVVLAAEAVPLSPAARAALAARPALIGAVLAGGDDYELAFTVPAAAAARVEPLASELGLPLTRVGDVVEAPARAAERVRVVAGDGRRLGLEHGGYRHF